MIKYLGETPKLTAVPKLYFANLTPAHMLNKFLHEAINQSFSAVWLERVVDIACKSKLTSGIGAVQRQIQSYKTYVVTTLRLVASK